MRQKTLPLLIACGLAAVLATSPAFANEDCNCKKTTVIHAGTTAASGTSAIKAKAKHKATGKHQTRVKTKAKAGKAVPVQRSKRASYRTASTKVVWAKNTKTQCADFKRTGDLSCACDDTGRGSRVSAPRVALKAAEWDRLK